MSNALDQKAPPKKKEKKNRVPEGKRVLGPGFLQRYGGNARKAKDNKI
jgi:hypothetical protein